MVDLIVDNELRGRMERLGLKRAAHFSWQKTAQQTLEIYREVAGQASPAGRKLRSTQSTPR